MKKNGFTLVELLIVVVILGIVTFITTSAVVSNVQKSKKETFIINAKNIIKTAEDYYAYVDALNKLPKKNNELIEGIKQLHFENKYSLANKEYTYTYLYVMDLSEIKNMIDIKDDYDGIIIFKRVDIYPEHVDYPESTELNIYLNLYNDDYAIYNNDNCKSTFGNRCFYSFDKITTNIIKTRKKSDHDTKKLQPTYLRKNNIRLNDVWA